MLYNIFVLLLMVNSIFKHSQDVGYSSIVYCACKLYLRSKTLWNY